MNITSAKLGSPVRYPNSHGDLWTATWADDGDLYVVSDDTYGFDRSCDSNLALHRLSGACPPDLFARTINPMREYGGMSEFRDEDDGMWKANGLSCIDGVLYLTVSRHAHQMKQRYFVQEAWDSSVVASRDHGQTWSAVPRLGHAMFAGHTFGTPFFVEYGQDGRGAVDGADEYIYATSSNGVWNNGSSMTLGRVPRARLAALDPRDWEFAHSFDERGEPIWRPRHDTARSVFRAPGRTSMTGVQHIAALQRYVMPQWHWSRFDDPALRWKRTKLEFYQAPKPWGPWTLFHEQEFEESWYNPCIPSKFISQDGRSLWLFVAGDFTEHDRRDERGNFCGPYGLWMIPMTLDVGEAG